MHAPFGFLLIYSIVCSVEFRHIPVLLFYLPHARFVVFWVAFCCPSFACLLPVALATNERSWYDASRVIFVVYLAVNYWTMIMLSCIFVPLFFWEIPYPFGCVRRAIKRQRDIWYRILSEWLSACGIIRSSANTRISIVQADCSASIAYCSASSSEHQPNVMRVKENSVFHADMHRCATSPLYFVVLSWVETQ